MQRFLTLNKKILIAFILLIGIFVLLSPEIKQGSKYNLLERPFLALTGFIQSAFATISGGISSTWHGYINLIDVQKENEMLSEEVQRLRSEIMSLQEKAATAERLSELLKLKESFIEKQTAAIIIAKDPVNWYEALVINKGHKDGVEPGMGVMTTEGVIGQIVKTAPAYSRVLLISDRNSAVAGLIQRTGEEGIVSGQHSRALRLDYIRTEADVQDGDLIVTSGTGGVFPRGIIIGRVNLVEKPQNRLFQTVELAPEANLSRAREVLVIKPAASSDAIRILQEGQE